MAYAFNVSSDRAGIMTCDLCYKPISEDESSFFVLEAQIGGHIDPCVRLFLAESEMELT